MQFSCKPMVCKSIVLKIKGKRGQKLKCKRMELIIEISCNILPLTCQSNTIFCLIVGSNVGWNVGFV